MRRRSGFTLIELMIVVAIIGILAAIAVPKFAELIRKSSEGSAKGKLSTMRSALSIYYADLEGSYPADPYMLTLAGKYLAEIPPLKVPDYHPETSAVDDNDVWGMGAMSVANNGHWIYWNWAAGLAPHQQGDVWIACTHTDTKGSVWTVY